ncbi:MAG: PRC-barrel domain-containing protein [Gammaproteobacteria bacterium]|nr:PRC-barrel domain-containing protein [Gammaproteobacteria bacterium]
MSSSRHQQTAPISRIIDGTLRHANGKLLGYVDELLIDLDSGRIEYVIALSVRGQRLRFPWASISVEGNSFVLHRSGPRLVIDGPPDTITP